MLTATDTPVGETLLIREYPLDQANSATQSSSSMVNTLPVEDKSITATPQRSHTGPGSSTHLLQANIAVQSLPYARPVTPQSFSRPHTASKALDQQQCE